MILYYLIPYYPVIKLYLVAEIGDTVGQIVFLAFFLLTLDLLIYIPKILLPKLQLPPESEKMRYTMIVRTADTFYIFCRGLSIAAMIAGDFDTITFLYLFFSWLYGIFSLRTQMGARFFGKVMNYMKKKLKKGTLNLNLSAVEPMIRLEAGRKYLVYFIVFLKLFFLAWTQKFIVLSDNYTEVPVGMISWFKFLVVVAGALIVELMCWLYNRKRKFQSAEYKTILNSNIIQECLYGYMVGIMIDRVFLYSAEYIKK